MGAATDRGHRRIARTGTIVGSKRALGALWAVLAIALAACGDAPPIEPVGHDPLSLRYTCGTFPFGPELLAAGPGRDELANTGRRAPAIPGEPCPSPASGPGTWLAPVRQ